MISSRKPQKQVISSKLMDATTCKSRATTNSVNLFIRDLIWLLWDWSLRNLWTDFSKICCVIQSEAERQVIQRFIKYIARYDMFETFCNFFFWWNTGHEWKKTLSGALIPWLSIAKCIPKHIELQIKHFYTFKLNKIKDFYTFILNKIKRTVQIWWR